MATSRSSRSSRTAKPARKRASSSSRKVAPRSKRTSSARKPTKKWSAQVTAHSDALDLEPETFRQRTPRAVASSLKRAADRSRRRKTDAFRSAMSMLTFFINRGGRGLSTERLRVLEKAKDELRELYGRPPATKKAAA